MNWLNLRTSQLRAPEFIGSDPTERATWLCLMAYCCEQENGGRIVGAGQWKDRQWQQMCGVTAREVARTSRLLATENGDVLVWGYDSDKESEVQELRARGSIKSDRKAAAARVNGANGGRPKTQQETEQETQQKTQQVETQHNPTETHRKEGEIERKEKGSTPKTSQSDASDASWLGELRAMDCYKPLKLPTELGKAKAWCAANRRQCTWRFFVNWLNRALESNRVIAPTRGQKPEHKPGDEKL